MVLAGCLAVPSAAREPIVLDFSRAPAECADEFVRAATSRPLLGTAGLAPAARRGRCDTDSCTYRLRVAPHGACVSRSWLRDGLRSADPAERWLLKPLEEVRLLRGPAPRLRFAPRPADLPLRLARLELWLPDCGCYELRGRELGRRSECERRGLPDRVRLAEPSPLDPVARVRWGEVDAVLLPRRAAQSLALGLSRVDAGAWDRMVVLWWSVPARVRWVRDPAFRAWVASELARDRALRELGEATRPGFLAPMEREKAGRWAPGPGSHPRFEMAFDEGDPEAQAIASAVRAALRERGVEVELVPVSREVLWRAARAGRWSAVLLSLACGGDDPLLNLGVFLARLGRSAQEFAADANDRAATLRRRRARFRAAHELGASMARDQRWAPLLRLRYAWVVRSERARDLRALTRALGFAGGACP